jgi:starvation-inducible DNA-binding protein
LKIILNIIKWYGHEKSQLIDSLSHLLIIERAILDKSAAINDEGSNAMMSDFISEQEKTIWMMQAWLEE